MLKGYRPKLAILALLALFDMQASAQARVDKDGRPLLVMDDSLSWIKPSLVYSAAGEEYYVPDLTRYDWIKSRFEQLGNYGTFDVFVYAYHIANHGLRGQRVEIDLKQKKASVYDFATPQSPPVMLSLTDPSSPLVQALNLKILPVVRQEMKAYYSSVYGQPPSEPGTYSSATH